jgi:hypothetical protein
MKKTMSKFDKQIRHLISYYHKNFDAFGNKTKKTRGKKHAR